MLTANVGHGQAVTGCGNASASAARSSVPSAPPAKIAATSRRSTLGSIRRASGPVRAPAARPGADDPARSPGGSCTLNTPFTQGWHRTTVRRPTSLSLPNGPGILDSRDLSRLPGPRRHRRALPLGEGQGRRVMLTLLRGHGRGWISPAARAGLTRGAPYL